MSLHTCKNFPISEFLAMEALNCEACVFSDLLDISKFFSQLVTAALEIYTPTSSVSEFTLLPTIEMSDFWNFINLMGINLYLMIILVCIFQITRDIELLFICLLAIQNSSTFNFYPLLTFPLNC